jgi:hypothetical protein
VQVTSSTRELTADLESPFLNETIRAGENDAANGFAPQRLEYESEKPTELGVVTILLDQPAESDDGFQLRSSDGAYTRTVRARDAKQLLPGERALRFESVPRKRIYRLFHLWSSKSESRRPVLIDLPYKDLTAAGQRPRTSWQAYYPLASQLARRLLDRYGTERPVDEDLIERTSRLSDVAVDDPVN